MRWIYLSPHFDDAVLSCGGLIWEQSHSGIAVEIWTICAGEPPPGEISPFARRVQDEWALGTAVETVALRRVEDQNAARRVGAGVVHFDVPDAIYRRTSTGSLGYPEAIFVPLNPREAGLVAGVAGLVSGKVNQYDTLVVPMAIGGHVDHRIVRAAAETLGRPLWYYADVPYFLRHPEALSEAGQGLTARNFFVSARGVSAWQAGVAAYHSQMRTLFEGEADMRQKIREYAREFDGLRLWEAE
jgi:LmbE family N-acetylglucosaminyl deacetylase